MINTIVDNVWISTHLFVSDENIIIISENIPVSWWKVIKFYVNMCIFMSYIDYKFGCGHCTLKKKLAMAISKKLNRIKLKKDLADI